jgi:CAAX protease family protein
MSLPAGDREPGGDGLPAERPPRPRVSAAWRVWLTVELLAFFVATPIAVYSLLYRHRVPLFEILPPVFLFFIVFLSLDRSFSWRETLTRLPRLRDLASIAAIFAVAGPAIALFGYHDSPSRFLAFPRHAFDLWLRIMILYPLISVTAQEIMYRVFFFHRYRPLFAGDAQAGIMLNAVLFSFSHIVFQSVTTLVISFLGGVLFAWRYESSRSFWALFLEHALYGNLIFTVGLGRYFYTGVSNL